MQLTEAYSFKLKLFTKTYMFEFGEFGFVLEKEPQVVCLYVTNKAHTEIYAAMPLCRPGDLKKDTLTFLPIGNSSVSFAIEPAGFRFFVDFKRKQCTNNRDMKIFGSEQWGQDVQVKWNEWIS